MVGKLGFHLQLWEFQDGVLGAGGQVGRLGTQLCVGRNDREFGIGYQGFSL